MLSTKDFTIFVALIFTWSYQVKAISSKMYPTEFAKIMPGRDDGHAGEIDISTKFPFFNKTFESLFVNANGVISFNVNVTQFTPSRFPLRDGRTMIAPFWADVDTRKTGTVYYGEYRGNTDNVKNASRDVINAFPMFERFSATWVFVASWINVTFHAKGFQPNATNTFQCVLITNGRHSFARFFYEEITWLSGTSSGGNASGLGGVEPECGFNAGDGINWANITKINFLDLPHTTNVNQSGVWMFRLDNALVEERGCNTKGHVTILPYVVPMLGGRNVNVHGPCFSRSDNITCKFGNREPKPGAFTPSSGCSSKNPCARCTIPMVDFIGQAELLLSLDGGKTFPYKGAFRYDSPENYKEYRGIKIKETINATTIKVEIATWNKRFLSNKRDDVLIQIAQYATTNSGVEFLGFRNKSILNETEDQAGFQILLHRKDVEGWIRSRNVEGTRAVSFLRVRKRHLFKTQASTTHEWIWSEVLTFPGNDEQTSSERCSNWAKTQDNTVPCKVDPTLIACPPKKDKAEEDNGRFSVNEKLSVFFKGQKNRKNITCFRMKYPSRKKYGQQCCYSNDFNGTFLFDDVNKKPGSFFKKHQDAGIPWISHYIYDILPFYDCCQLNNTFCERYYKKRPSVNGCTYKPPRAAVSNGDPHMVTLDGVQYTFNGYGEFVILKISNDEFMLQGRMEQLNRINGTSINATVYTAFVMKSNVSDTVQIQLSDNGNVDVLIDGEKKDFDEDQTILFSNGQVEKKPNTTKYVVLFSNGMAVIVEGEAKLLQLMVKVPAQYLGKTNGLLGYFDNDKEKEFLLPDGTFLKTSSKAATLHYEFGLKWAIETNQSLFTYFGAKNHSFFTNPFFVPLMFDYDNLTFANPQLEAESRRICQGDVQCLVDAIATGQPSFALLSRNIKNEFKRVLKITKRKDCIPLFPEFAFGQMQTELKDGEIKYKFKCNPNFILDGPEQISCKNGLWNGTKPSCRGCSLVDKNVIIDSKSLTGLDEVTYKLSCTRGHELFGPNIVICKGGEWNENKPVCIKGCPTIAPNVVVINTNTTAINEITYRISCKSGYAMLGSSTMKCRSGEWLSNTTRCLKELKTQAKASHKYSRTIIVVSISCSLAFVAIVTVVWCSVLRRKRTNKKETIPAHGKEYPSTWQKENSEENTAVVLSVLDLSKEDVGM